VVTEPPIAGKIPKDLNKDGKCEGVNGDGKLSFADVIFFFKHFEDKEVKNYPQFFDFNNDGKINFADVIALFKIL